MALQLPDLKDLPKIVFAQWQKPQKRYPFIVALLSLGIVTFITSMGFIFSLLTVSAMTGATYLATITIQYFLRVTQQLEERLNTTDQVLIKTEKNLADLDKIKVWLGDMGNEVDAALIKMEKGTEAKFEKLEGLANKFETLIENIKATANSNIDQSIQNAHQETVQVYKNAIKELYNEHLSEMKQDSDILKQAINNIQNITLPTLNTTAEAQAKTHQRLNSAMAELQTSAKGVKDLHTKFEQKVNTTTKEVKDLHTNFEKKLNNGISEQQEKVKQTKKYVDFLDIRTQAIERNVSDLKNETENAKKDVKDLQKDIVNAHHSMSYLSGDLETLIRNKSWRSQPLQWKTKTANNNTNPKTLNERLVDLHDEVVELTAEPLVPAFNIRTYPGHNIIRAGQPTKLLADFKTIAAIPTNPVEKEVAEMEKIAKYTNWTDSKLSS